MAINTENMNDEQMKEAFDTITDRISRSTVEQREYELGMYRSQKELAETMLSVGYKITHNERVRERLAEALQSKDEYMHEQLSELLI